MPAAWTFLSTLLRSGRAGMSARREGQKISFEFVNGPNDKASAESLRG
jgi:hypothetical protein